MQEIKRWTSICHKSEKAYKELLKDLKKLEFTGIVLTKWNIGKRILKEFEKLGKPEYGNKRIENLAKDLGGSSSDLYACIQFAKKYPKIPTAWENSSWRDVRNNFLPELKRDVLIKLSSLVKKDFYIEEKIKEILK